MKSPLGTMTSSEEEAASFKPSQLSVILTGLLMLGIALGMTIDSSLQNRHFAVGMILLMTTSLGLWWWCVEKGRVFAGRVMMVVVMLTFGIGLEGFHRPQDDIAIVPQETSITGRVVMAEVMTNNRQRIRLHPDEPSKYWQGKSWADLRLITAKGSAPLKLGDRIQGDAQINRPLPRLLPGSFDFTAHARRLNFAGHGFIKNITVIDHQKGDVVSLLRHGIQQRFFEHLTPDQAAIASAVIVGLRGGIAPQLREEFRASGLAHLLAISGLHMALFWGSVVALIRGGLALFSHFSSRYPSLKIATVAAMPFGFFYLMISGQPISAVRAFSMLALFMVAILLSRRGVTLYNVALVAIGILAISPHSLTHPAFQMSFAAVYALVAGWMVLSRHRGYVSSWPKIARYLGGIIVASLLASLASAPFVLHHFGVTTFWSLLANLAGMPLMGVVVIPFGAAALLLMPLGLEALPLTVMGWGLDGLNLIAGYAASQPFSKIALPPPSALVLIFFTASLIMPHCLSGRWRLLSLISLMTGVVIWAMTPVPVAVFTSLHQRPIAAFYGADSQVYWSRRQVNDFTKGIILKPFGVSEGEYLGDRPCAECGSGYHILTLKDGQKAAMVWRRKGFTFACREADLILALETPLYPCAASMLITKDDIMAKGGVMIFGGEGFAAQFVQSP